MEFTCSSCGISSKIAEVCRWRTSCACAAQKVLPFTAGAHPAMLGSFTLMQFPDPADRDVVYLEAETGALYLEKPEDVRRYSLMIDYLRAQALGPAESRALIAHLAARPPT